MFGFRARMKLYEAKAAVADVSIQLSDESLQRSGEVGALLDRGDIAGAKALGAAATAYHEAAVLVLKLAESM
jgi:hypothetical protein